MAHEKQPRYADALDDAKKICQEYRHEYIMPEHLLEAISNQKEFIEAGYFDYDYEDFKQKLDDFLESIEKLPEGNVTGIDVSDQFFQMYSIVQETARMAGKEGQFSVPLFINAMLQLEESYAAYLLRRLGGNHLTTFLSLLITNYEEAEFASGNDTKNSTEGEQTQKEATQQWHQLVTCLNETYQKHNPLIGREAELERTIQVLCRKEKNNPLHIGEPGVGKTALVYGLAQLIAEDKVPYRLKGCRIYQVDLGNLVAGTTYRGDFEKRIKQILEGAQQEGNAIIYIDEIHNLVGAGAASGSIDGAHMMMPYMERGDIRFIGSTTYEQLNKQLSKNQAVIRRFHQIDIAEPSIEETKNILRQLRPNYEAFHNVVYEDAALDYAVEASAKYINDRFLPDKAIDLIDEAGAATALNPQTPHSPHPITRQLIAEVLAKTCKIDTLAMKDDDNSTLENLSERILGKIYGQDEAVRQVVEAVQMSKAGLIDDQKPLASLLFVGPTGVGKTEVARVLAKEMGVELVRFDMSEYTEEHAVAKFIGSPAGYVGYEDGGLLVDAIRKTPNCVLLLDEIEKAHQKIYNILLQVMDYARLTDNKGRKADFRNVVIIMTSNAGAQYASQASIGFNGHVSRGEAMLAQVKKTFKPEFLNRLSGTVVFHDIDRPMAILILRKKLDELQQKLKAKQVEMTLTEEAFNHLLKQGFTREYGAREMDRIIAQQLKPLLMRQILFGSLKQGGAVTITLKDSALAISDKK